MDPLKGNTANAPTFVNVSTKRQRIAMLARRSPQTSFTTLAHNIDLEWLEAAYHQVRKDGAPGVDQETAASYSVNLGANLQSLLDRAKSGQYKAPPVRRVHIPKGKGGKTRPIGIPTFEDKVLQRAVAMVLESIYEQDFMDCSYGFRPGRSAHQALESLRDQQIAIRAGWVLDVDVQGFFDALDHAHLRAFLKRRVRDGVLIRLIGKWLNAGVLEDGCLQRTSTGTPQGGVISPILANVYLHYVLDQWFEQEVKSRLRGQAFVVRYADDFIIGFSSEHDAHGVMDVLPKRFGKYGLTIHPEKTRLVRFNRPAQTGNPPKGGKPESFDFLGFTHYWGRSRRGYWVVQRKTASSRLSRSLRSISEWCRVNRHLKVREQHAQLSRKVSGHYAYYGITGNGACLEQFWEGVKRIWKKWLGRRSQRAYFDWSKFVRLLQRYPLPKPVVVRSVYRKQRSRDLRSRMR
ncbi:MAG: group II intron reverse transcriptase/maturase [Gemmatimonadales bacterium]|nr:group II intron reverse transcriptase/maturase [Gemmatimonadales bacterium]